MTVKQQISHYESRSMSISDRIESYEWQVEEADKVIKKNQEWKDHSLEEIKKSQDEAIFVANKLNELKGRT